MKYFKIEEQLANANNKIYIGEWDEDYKGYAVNVRDLSLECQSIVVKALKRLETK